METKEKRDIVRIDVIKPEFRPKPEYYTLPSLRAENSSYNLDHKVTQYDVNKVNRLIDCVHSYIGLSVQQGDRMQAVGENHKGEKRTYTNALIQDLHGGYCRERAVNMCVEPYVPFTEEDCGRIVLSASGGYWLGEKNFKAFEHVGYVKGNFCTWGHCGGCANGAVRFKTYVNYWYYENKEKIY